MGMLSWFTGVNSGLVGIEVSPRNPHFSSEEGVLFNKDKTILTKFPRRKLNSHYIVPDGVRKIDSYAFSSCNRLTYIEFPDSLTEVDENAFEHTNAISNLSQLTAFADKAAIMHHSYVPTMHDYPRALVLCAAEDISRINQLLIEMYWEGFSFHYGQPQNDSEVLSFHDIIRKSPCTLVFFSQNTVKSTNLLKLLDSAQQDCAEKIVQIFLGGYFDNPHNMRTLQHHQAIVQERLSLNEFAGKIRSTLRKHECTLGHPRGFDVIKHAHGVEITKFHPTDFGHVIIPETFFDPPLPVISIGTNAFADCITLESVVIPNCVERIGKSAFYNCSSLKYIKIGHGTTVIGEDAFDKCSLLMHIDIPDSVQTIGSGAFSNCTSLRTVKIPDSVTALGDFAFYGCSSLTKLFLGDGLKTVGDKLLLDCGALTTVSLGANIDAQGWDDLGLFRHSWRNKGTKNNTWSIALADILVSPSNPWFASVDGVLYSKDMDTLIFCPPMRDAEQCNNLPAPVAYTVDNTPFVNATKEDRFQAMQAVQRTLQLRMGIESLFLSNNIPYVCGFTDYDEPEALELINCFHEYPEWIIGGSYFAGENFLFASSQKVYYAKNPESYPLWIMEDSTLLAESSIHDDVIVYTPSSCKEVIAMVLDICNKAVRPK